jgi:LacI family transcriptional regulator
MGSQRITLRDVARRVGVHPSTVSRVLNPVTRNMVTPEIAQRVTEAAQSLGYRPNPFAYSLKTNRSRLVGVLVPDLVNPIFPPILRGIEAVLEAAGYTAIVANTDNQEDRERVILERMGERQVDGLILATAHRADARAQDPGLPLVFINRTVDDRPVYAVVNEDKAGIRLAVEHLASRGHRRIAHIAGPQSISTGFRRREGFEEVLREAGLPVEPRWIVPAAAYTEVEGQKALAPLLNGGPPPFTGIVAANDLLALGCYDALQECGLRCPEDVSVTGFNDMPMADKLRPPLTTVRIPHYEIGAEAARLLLGQLTDPPEAPHTVSLMPTLVVRGSTGAAPAEASAAGGSRRE